jgi:hypothetical protein
MRLCKRLILLDFNSQKCHPGNMADWIHFSLNKEKTIEALVYLASARPGVDVFHACKVLFYTDLNHFRRYGRPVTGDQYYAMKDGPVPSFAYDVVRRNVKNVSQELLSVIDSALIIAPKEQHYSMNSRRSFNRSLFSKTDVICMDESIARYADMTFGTLWTIVHQEESYKQAYVENTSSVIPYDLLFPKDMPNRAKAIEQIKEVSKAVAI